MNENYFDKLQNVASIELMLSIKSKEIGKALKDIHSVFQQLQVPLPTTISIDKVIDLDARAISNASYYVWESRKNSFANRSLFAPHKDNLLQTGIKDELNYTKGNFVTTNTYLLNERNWQQQLNTATTTVLRHVMITLSIPLHNLNSLWFLFHVLITGKVLPTARFSNMNTIWNNVMQLNKFDSKNKSICFADSISKLSKYGFCQYFGASSDDSEHHRNSMHLLIAANIIKNEPSFRLLSCTPAQGNDAEGNAWKNFNVLKGVIKDAVLGHYVGSTTDNANSAMAETRVLFEKIIQYLKKTDKHHLL